MSLDEGVALMRKERWFDAHEELEDEWRRCATGERDFLQGLVHVTVGWYHASRANTRGARGQLTKAQRRLDPYRPAHRGIDVDDVLRQVDEALAALETGTRLPPITL
jgi:predicted metal-dependent hydrolase